MDTQNNFHWMETAPHRYEPVVSTSGIYLDQADTSSWLLQLSFTRIVAIPRYRPIYTK
jgi:hypothetical protein